MNRLFAVLALALSLALSSAVALVPALGVTLMMGSPAAAQDPPAAIAADLDAQLSNAEVPLLDGYEDARPRLLYGIGDREALKAKAAKLDSMWAEVIRSARGAGAGTVPTAEAIESGSSYWRIERVQSAALAWMVTGNTAFADGAAAWMVAHCRQEIWGNTYRPNRDLEASWYLYHIAIAYDTLHATLSDADRKIIRDGLASHAQALADGLREFQKSGIRYDQNHTYIPAVALTAAALALQGEVPQADEWLRLSWAVMLRSRYALGEDGYYYEGTAYWAYALHWHARWAEMMSRATGLKLMELPALRDNWRYAMFMTLPGEPGAFDIGDTGLWREAKRPARMRLTNTTMLWSVAAQLRDGKTQMAANLMYKLHVEKDYPAAAFLWYDPSVEATPQAEIKPWHHFTDHNVIAWRSGWADEDTAMLFRCGPPQGHAATAKLGVMKDWTMNSGHVHPDIGGFWIYARGTYLAVDTGYLAEKWTHNHNTLLVGGKGQGIDGSYWNDRGMDYKLFNRARITASNLQSDHGFASGEFASVYPADLKLKQLRRSVVMTRDWALLVDEMESDLPQTLTWLCHSDVPFEAAKEGGGFVARSEKAALAVLPLGPAAVSGGNTRTEVVVGSVPMQGKKLETNYHLRLETEAAETQRLATLLVFLDADQQPPKVRLISADADRVTIEITDAAAAPYEVTIELATGELRGLKKQ